MFEPKDKKFNKDSLQTPKYIFDWLNSKYLFDVDLAASDAHHFCIDYYDEHVNALEYKWGNYFKTGFLNPPYSNIDPWVDLAIQEIDNDFTTVMLIPDFNGEARFERIARHATTIIHLIGRVSFIRPDNSEEYKGNNRGSCIVEFSHKYWDIPPNHLYFNIKDIKNEFEK